MILLYVFVFGFVLRDNTSINHTTSEKFSRALLVVLCLLCKHNPTNNARPFGPARALLLHLCQCPTQCLLCRYFIRKRRLVEDLSRLLNDIRYGSFIIVGLPGKLQKRERLLPIFKRENKGIKLTKMV